MKALANADEAEYAPQMAPVRITWTRIRDGEWWGTTGDSGPAYKITRVGRIDGETLWRLQEFANADAKRGADLDDGSLATLKVRAARHAAETAVTPVAEPV